ncbi:peptidoglycan-associated lipoprotein Pal [Gallaecimonas pentaromativorans]|uniref:Peptidoglycan-associated lipoprotein n=1 Tax=Gallaecimonas pentaromativorans TaxID=584787 RepID=A0A3N1PV50_9GAMM|nr:peptidoglycan-associated lipoprotein Pal [Gallaecimonas pentaromativorans]MED5524415.1 peptidoglycan-associated lipoprotein Pal [Pseudomonadota bacterium]ROQ28426.1 peptidoglycan-associated lipoprotein [Gallaecimonas pentaromativorans]
MQHNKLLKGMLLALPILALSACSSTSGTDKTTSKTSSNQQQEVVTGTVEPVMSAEEQRKQRMEEMRREHIIYFEFDKYDIRPEFAELLEAHAAYLREHSDVKVLIEGHADERGTPEYNIALGEKRAKAVKQYLLGLGVLDSQISIVSYGEEKPLDPSHTEAAFAKNRRAVLVY